ncbi:MAG: hypothetical protein H6502_00010 [Candidatus Woesearchaeota archaeon]|nr:MAG: hypothetical protein H6502_00010 [Candidatus Woesearchaeota archaeon]
MGSAHADTYDIRIDRSSSESFLYSGEKMVARVDGADISFFHYDHLGNVRAMTNGAGDVVYSASYTPFGGLLDEEVVEVENDLTYAAKEFDRDSGLLNFGARHYSPLLGRFMSADSFEGSVVNPQSLNRYAYVLNNPMNLVDPTGQASEEEEATAIWRQEYMYGFQDPERSNEEIIFRNALGWIEPTGPYSALEAGSSQAERVGIGFSGSVGTSKGGFAAKIKAKLMQWFKIRQAVDRAEQGLPHTVELDGTTLDVTASAKADLPDEMNIIDEGGLNPEISVTFHTGTDSTYVELGSGSQALSDMEKSKAESAEEFLKEQAVKKAKEAAKPDDMPSLPLSPTLDAEFLPDPGIDDLWYYHHIHPLR